MGEDRRRRREKTEKKVRLTALLVFLLVLGLSGGGYAYAKYYSQSYQKGVAIASGVYFTANYAAASEEYFESIVKSGYSGGDAEFDFEIRNYENNMLFNEKSIEIPYSVWFWLEEAPEGATYTVTRIKKSTDGEVLDGEPLTLQVGKNNKVGFADQMIAGGSALANKYKIIVDAADGVEHESVPIYVEARTAEGAVISSTLRGKMVFSTQVVAESYIESQGFSGNSLEEIKAKSEFTYEIKTVGAVAGGENTEELKLSWDPTILEINMFDDAFRAWKKTSGENEPLEDNVNSGWVYITVNVMPYSAETIGFFRGSNFDTKVQSMDALNGSIKVEKVVTLAE